MKKMTEQHLINAFGGESQAHMRYLHFANQAEQEKFNNVARLFAQSPTLNIYMQETITGS